MYAIEKDVKIPALSYSECNTVVSGGFIIPEVGFETFCGSHSLKVFVTIDTYDLDPTDGIIGEIFETLESNNVKYTTDTFTLDKSQMDCSKYLNLDIPRCK